MSLPKAWVEAPTITALSDAPIEKALAEQDKFRLTRSMGPVLDILRHHKTQTPLSCAIYGTWGSGKSTAMHWLREGLDHWNQQVDDLNREIENEDDHWPHVLSVNFYPWKYTSKEDVWRGLIVEIIIACIKHRDDDSKTISEVVGKFAGFLGGKLITALSALKLKGTLYGVEGTIDVKQLVKVFENEEVNPETAYLNEFEKTLEIWVQDILTPTKNEGQYQRRYRLVVFIDDLDRCMPDVALQVLEALKLYLNIPGLIFVLGLDKTVVEQLVTKHYETLGVAKDKSRHYLAKMFQVEVNLEPQDSLVGEYVRALITDDEWQSLGIAANSPQKKVFLDVIQELGEHSPRETKRLVNSTLMLARGAQMIIADGSSEEHELTAIEAIQVHLIEEVLRRRHAPMTHYWMRREHGQQFFIDWAEQGIKPLLDGNVESGSGKNDPLQILYADGLLKDLVGLGTFPSSHKLKALPQKEENTNLDFRKAVEEQCGMTWEELEETGFQSVKELSFRGQSFKNWNELLKFKSLTSLDLEDCPIEDGTIFRNLKNLSNLYIARTKISDFGFLSDLTHLSGLSISGASVAVLKDIMPKMGKLIFLLIIDLNASDLNFLSGLNKLKYLSILNAQVADYSALANLKNLHRLNIGGTNISDPTPLLELKQLEYLSLPKALEANPICDQIRGNNPNIEIFFH